MREKFELFQELGNGRLYVLITQMFNNGHVFRQYIPDEMPEDRMYIVSEIDSIRLTNQKLGNMLYPVFSKAMRLFKMNEKNESVKKRVLKKSDHNLLERARRYIVDDVGREMGEAMVANHVNGHIQPDLKAFAPESRSRIRQKRYATGYGVGP